jgi:hypothetical protein
LAGIVGVIYLDVSSQWSIIPEYRQRGGYEIYRIDKNWRWDLFRLRYWQRANHENWIFLICLFGPILTAKSIEWVMDSKRKE